MTIPLLLWILFLIVPILIGLLMVLIIWTSFRRSMEGYKLSRKTPPDIDARKKVQIIMFISMAIVPVAYGMVMIGILLSAGEPAVDYQKRALNLSGWIYCIPAVIAMISQTIIITFLMSDFLETKDPEIKRIKTRGFSSSYGNRQERTAYQSCLIVQTIPQTVATYGLLIAIFMLTFSGIMGGDQAASEDNSTAEITDGSGEGFEINEDDIADVKLGSMIFIGLSCVSILSGIVPTFVKGKIMDRKVFGWRLGLAIGGTLPSIAGLLIWILLMGL